MSKQNRTTLNSSESGEKTDNPDQYNPEDNLNISKMEKDDETAINFQSNRQPDETTSHMSSDSVSEMEKKIETLENEVQANYDRLLRVSADFDNYKKRSAREMNELRKYATEVLLKDMLSVLDNLDRAVETGSKPDTDKQALLEGVKMIQNEVLRILEKHGVQPFDSQGEPFNPTFHEAMMQEETEDYAENTITNELQKGYMIHDRLLRPAMVVVAKASSDSENNHNNEDIEK
jgi:molecular chaperone GrpE